MNINTTGFNVDYYPATVLPPNIAAFLYLLAGVLFIFGIIVILSARRKRRSATNIVVGTVILLAGFALGAFALYKNHFATREAPVFAPRTMLSSLWTNYKQDYLDPTSSRTMDIGRQNITTSEGESYSMLRAVWMGDRETFDASWNWTQKNLQRPSDKLFAWLYGTRGDGAQGILTEQGGMNPASDADTDIALALVLAYSRWQDESYLRAALPIINSIWNKEVFVAGGKPYLAASLVSASTSAQTGTMLVNPSYFAPYAYRIFAVLDRTHNWQSLINASYDLLDKSITMPLDKETTAGLPPDWMMVNIASGELSAPAGTELTTNFGYDALRVPFRIALDAIWNNEPRAIAFLKKLDVLTDKWGYEGRLYSVYTHDGVATNDYESPAMYGGTIGYFMVADPNPAKDVYSKKLESLYSQDIQTWKQPLSYYDANIAWFGLALYNDALQNLFTLNFNSTSSSTVTTTAPRS